jgi:hypothetical protein
VVGAVDARLKEHAGQVERRLAEMEARVALELKSLRQQDQAVIAAAQSRVDEVQSWCREGIAAARGELSAEIVAVRDRPAAVPADLERIVEERVAARFDSRVPAAGVEEQFGLLRAQLAAANAEIVELRQLVAESGSASRALLLAIGEACRESAGRIAQPAPETAQPTRPMPAAQPEPAAVAEVPAPSESSGPGALWTEANHQQAPDPPVEFPAPAFTEPRKPGRPWRVPLVSSFLVTFALVAFRFF